MIDNESLFNEIKDNFAFFCPEGQDSGAIIRTAESVIDGGISIVSVPPESAGMIWTWLESVPTKIYSRFIFNKVKKKSEFIEEEISKLSASINFVFKKGADGAQIFIPMSEFYNFVSDLLPIRDDLFFGKDLFVCLDIDEIEQNDWENIFSGLKKIKADVLLHIGEKNKNDFIGRIYGLCNSIPNDFDSDIHFIFGNDYEKIEQTWRLFQKTKPVLLNKLKFFINN